jgi:hypothetical protein
MRKDAFELFFDVEAWFIAGLRGRALGRGFGHAALRHLVQ